MAKKLTYWILGGLVLGIVVGWALNAAIGDGTPEGEAKLAAYAHYITILTTIFLHLIKMIIAPLVLSTLVVGIAHMHPPSSRVPRNAGPRSSIFNPPSRPMPLRSLRTSRSRSSRTRRTPPMS